MLGWLCSFNFLTKFYFSSLKILFSFLIYMFYTIFTIIKFVLVFFCKFIVYLVKLNTNVENFFIWFISRIKTFFFFVFLVLPWWFFNKIFKKYTHNYYSGIKLYFNKSEIFKKVVSLFISSIIFLKNFFLKLMSKIICSLFDIYNISIYAIRFNLRLKKTFFFFINVFLIFFSFIVIIKTNIIVILHNILFGDLIDVIEAWNFAGSKMNYLFLLILLLNLDNLILILYIIFTELGMVHVFFVKKESLPWNFWVGQSWAIHFDKYKTDNQNFSFSNLILNKLIQKQKESSFFEDFTYLTFTNFSSDGLPVFFYFGFLFFLSVIFSWFYFSYLGLDGIFKLNIITITLFWLSLLLYVDKIFIDQIVYNINIGNWVFLNLNLRVHYYFLIDTISFSFILLTTSIALFVFIFAFSYFRYEPLVDRFLLFLLSFVISMIFLVSSGNTIMLFLGWELIGFTSFCLINFWTTKIATMKSAFKAFSFNKVSDFFLFLFLVFSFNVFYSFDILQINKNVLLHNHHVFYILGKKVSSLEFLSILLVGAAFIKSAQLGGHVWLPDSMEAPVPASALIHSATLVSAGVYLILRFNPIFDLTEFVKFIIPFIGSLTAAYGGLCALTQSDIKKTLAYSTISHCGFLMVLCSTEMNEFTILYLYVHGFFKAGVFMCVGNVLRVSRGYQDTRRMGSLLKYLPFDYFCITVGLLNLAGLPFTFGFMIKHLLLISLGNNIYLHYFVLFNCFIGAFTGLFYSYKIITYTFCDFKKGDFVLYNNANKINYNSSFYSNSSVAATISIFFLFIFAYIIIIYMFNCFLSGNYQFSDYINTTLLLNYYIFDNTYSGFLLNFSYINIVVLIIISYLFWSKFKKTTRSYNNLKYLHLYIVFFIFIFIFYNIL